MYIAYLYPPVQFSNNNIFNMWSFMNVTNGTFVKRATLKAMKYDADDEMLLLQACELMFSIDLNITWCFFTIGG